MHDYPPVITAVLIVVVISLHMGGICTGGVCQFFSPSRLGSQQLCTISVLSFSTTFMVCLSSSFLFFSKIAGVRV